MRSLAPEAPTPDDHATGDGAPAGARRRPLAALLAGVALVAIVASGCNLPVDEWVPDFDGDGTISQAEIDRQSQVVVAAVARAVEPIDGTSSSTRS